MKLFDRIVDVAVTLTGKALEWVRIIYVAALGLAMVGAVIFMFGSCVVGTFFGTPGPDKGGECVAGPQTIEYTVEECYTVDYICADGRQRSQVGERGSPFEKLAALDHEDGHWYVTYEQILTGEIVRKELSVCPDAKLAQTFGKTRTD